MPTFESREQKPPVHLPLLPVPVDDANVPPGTADVLGGKGARPTPDARVKANLTGSFVVIDDAEAEKCEIKCLIMLRFIWFFDQ
jgi:hypothetical protein